MKKYLAELLGTFILVLFGCGAVVVLGGLTAGIGGGTLGVLIIAVAFGLGLLAAITLVGKISGAHVNPAVSLGMLLIKKISVKDFFLYVVAQVIGAFLAVGVIAIIIHTSTGNSVYTLDLFNYGANGYGSLSSVDISLIGAIVVETILTFIFVSVVLTVATNKSEKTHGGLIIGAALTMVHIIGIPLTGTSVNPARSLAPAVVAGGDALSQVWVFILAPLLGAVLAAAVYILLHGEKKEELPEGVEVVEVIETVVVEEPVESSSEEQASEA